MFVLKFTVFITGRAVNFLNIISVWRWTRNDLISLNKNEKKIKF